MLYPGSIVVTWRRRSFFLVVVLLAVLLVLNCVFAFDVFPHRGGSDPTSPDKPSRMLLAMKVLGAGTGLVIVLWMGAGRFVFLALTTRLRHSPVPRILRGDITKLRRPDGTVIHMESHGLPSLPTLILIHGWSLNSRQWAFSLPEWTAAFRVVTWDLVGMGQSSQAKFHDYSLERMAHDLRAVLLESRAEKVAFVGHSIGGMVILTFCRLYPELLGTLVIKLVLVHTTSQNPLATMARGERFLKLQKSVIEPMLKLQILVWPLIWVIDYLSFWSGSLQWTAMKTGFSAAGEGRKVDLVASFYAQDSPAVLARGALAMLSYDETETLTGIRIPVLVFGAQDDPLTVVQAAERIANDVEDGTLIILESAKHMGLIEFDQQFSAAVREFCLGSPRS